MENKRFYVTTPIYYPSDKLHIGHTLTTTMADSLRRYKEMDGYETYFLTGSDEHGQKIERIAKAAGVAPIEYTNKIVDSFKDLWKNLNINYDQFIRTTDENHKENVQHIFQVIYDNGDIYKSEYEGFYCTSCETFYTDFQVTDGKCPDCGKDIEIVKEESYFFKMSKYSDQLLKYIDENKDFIKPETRRNEMISFINQGLQDLCISRNTFKWGIPLTIDEDHVIYVWFDALTNYISALGYKDDEDLYEKFWVNNDEVVHLVGKDILRFHTIIWPAMLLSAGIKLPKTIFGHGWLLQDGDKMSKSKGNVTDPNILIEKYGADSLRYFLMRELPYNSDVFYSEEALIKRINMDLANDFGNMLSRTVSMVDKYFEGNIQIPKNIEGIKEKYKDVVDQFEITYASYKKNMDALMFNNGISSIFDLISKGNKLIEEEKPWELMKEGKIEELASLIYVLLEIIRVSSTLLSPILTEAKGKVMEQMGISDPGLFTFNNAHFGVIKESYKVCKMGSLFPRIDLKSLELNEVGQKDNPKNNKKTNKENIKSKKDMSGEKEEGSNLVTIDEFFKTQMKVGKIESCVKVENTDKLLNLKVNVGEENLRNIVAGLGAHYKEDELIGKKVIVVTNLKPAKLRGIMSEGMLLAASKGEDVILLTVEKDIEEGASVG